MGATLAPVPHPDIVITHSVTECELCRHDLSRQAPVGRHRRQVIDLPARRAEVTEHQVEVKECPCGHRTTAAFPADVRAPMQYGPEILAEMAYLHDYQLIPMQRIRELARDLWQLSLSFGPLMRSLQVAATRLAPIMEDVRLALQQDLGTVGADETSIRWKGSTDGATPSPRPS